VADNCRSRYITAEEYKRIPTQHGAKVLATITSKTDVVVLGELDREDTKRMEWGPGNKVPRG
jgi:hypothetical protein